MVRNIFSNPSSRSFRLQALVVACCVVAQPAASQTYEFKGRVIAANEAEIAARNDGRLVRINFAPGQIVKKGDLLFEFDQTSRQISLSGAQARQKVLEAQLRLADVRLKNAQTLRSRNVSSEMQLLEAQAQRDIAAANADEARASVQVAQLQLDQTRLFAPIDGVIGRPQVREGAYLTLAAMDKNILAVITQLNPILVVAESPFESYAQRQEMFDSRKQASEALEYTVVLPNGDKYPHKGRLVGVISEFNPATQSIAVAVQFENPDLLLRPGLNVTVQSSVRGK